MSDSDGQTEDGAHDGNGPVTPDRSPPRAAPNVAFTRAMIGVRTRCQQIEGGIENHDYERVGHLAQAAANLWLTGRSACRRLVEGAKPHSPYGESARQELEREYMALLAVFRQALDMFDVPHLQRTLLDLREMLRLAMAKPLLEPVSSPTPSRGKPL